MSPAARRASGDPADDNLDPSGPVDDDQTGVADHTLDDSGVESGPASRRRRRGPARAETQPKRHRAALLVAIGSLVLVAVAATSGYLINRLNPTPVATTTVVARATWPLALPVTVGDYSRNVNQGASPSSGADGKQAVAATYAKGGQAAITVLAARPTTDLKTFLIDLNVGAVQAVEDAQCGIQGDGDNYSACAVVRDGTGILVLDLQGSLSRESLVAIAKQVATQMAGS